MKKSIFIILVFCFSTALFSQSGYPLIQEGNSWNVLAAGVFPFFDTVYSTITYKITGDTILNSVLYKKLYESGEEFPDQWALWGFMREDSTGKAWYKEHGGGEDFLLYNFSANQGDELQIGMYEPVTLLVDSITTINIDGSDRSKLWLSCNENPYYTETWIEGIGSDKGIVWSGSAYIVGGFYRLLCLSENDELVFVNPEYDDCYINTVGMPEMIKIPFEIFPNPAKNFLNITSNTNFTFSSIQITDLSGKIVASYDGHPDQIDISSIPAGMYFIIAECESGMFTRKVFISK